MRPSNSLKNKIPSDTLKSSGSMYESSGSHSFCTTTEIQSGPDAYEKSSLFMTLSTKVVETRILCSFRFILEGKASKRIKRYLSHQDKSFQKSFFQTHLWCIRSRRQHLRSAKQRKYSRLTFLDNTIRNSPKFLRTKFLGRDRTFCFISTRKFGSFKNPENPFTPITSLSEIHFRCTRFILFVQTKVISMTYDSSTSS